MANRSWAKSIIHIVHELATQKGLLDATAELESFIRRRLVLEIEVVFRNLRGKRKILV
jgi:phage gp36-like protein